LNIYTTAQISRDELSDRRHKISQLVITWLIPIIGAILVLYLHRRERFEKREYQIDAGDRFGDFS